MRAFAIVALLLAACAPAGAPAPEGTSSPAGTAAAAPATWPLRGTNAGADAKRRPIVVRIGNDDAARPQAGISKADLIMELMVEGGITRLAVVFHSQDADRIGPVRSARLSDLHYTPMLRGILAHVGGHATVLVRVRDSARGGAFIDVDQFEHAGAFERISQRPAPHNVFTSTSKLREAAQKAGDRGNVAVPSLEYSTEKPAGGKDATSFTVPYTQQATYAFDGGAYTRSQGGKTVDEATKGDVKVDNVVVMKTDHTETDVVGDEHGSKLLELKSTGTGTVVVLREGQRFDGTWSRDGTDMYRFVGSDGKPITLKPGLTWMHIVPSNFDLGT